MSENQSNQENNQHLNWKNLMLAIWRTPLGLGGICISTISFTLVVTGIIANFLGLVHNPYFDILCYVMLPMGIIIGLVAMIIAGYLWRRKWFKNSLASDHLIINLSDSKHRNFILGFLAVGVFNISFLLFIAYEGYHFTDSPQFCGTVCHQVMEPEYTAYQRSPHANIACVECHIGSGAKWYVKAKITGMKQLVSVVTGEYSRPIAAPVEHLRPARDICESCHWPEKFVNQKIKTFTSFSNDDQENPEIQDITLRIGGRDPVTNEYKGIHWHVSKDVKIRYQALNKQRTEIGQIEVTNPDGTITKFNSEDIDEGSPVAGEWRTMDCIDCHNRPTHVYDELEERVDFGLLSTKLDHSIPGIREDSITTLEKEYVSRDEAQKMIPLTLNNLQTERNGEDFVKSHTDEIEKAANYLINVYMANIWPNMKIEWGTYRSHLGHKFSDDGFGCFRCHNEEHSTTEGDTISQDCDSCHAEPE